MHEQLRELVKDRLSGAVNCPAKDDVIEEITADLTAKYNDLLESGHTPDEAFANVQKGIGDLGEVVSFINEANRRSEQANKKSDNPFAGLEDLMRQLGKTLEPSMREVASDMKSAAGHLGTAARELARESKGPMKEMLHSVKESLKKASVKIDLRDKVRYDYTVPAAALTDVEVRTTGGDVTFGVSQDDNIYIVELASTELSEDKLARIQAQDDILTIEQGRKSSAGSVLFNYEMLSSDFEIYLPQRAWNAIRVTTKSGDVELESGLEVANLELHTTSGDLTVPELTCGACRIETTSGDVELSGSCMQADVSTVSGDMEVSGSFSKVDLSAVSGDVTFCGSAPQLELSSTSGDLDLKLENLPDTLTMSTVSGDTRLYLPDNDGFYLHYNRVSGEVRSDFNLKTSLSDKSGTAVYLSGADRHYTMNTVSGDLRIYRR